MDIDDPNSSAVDAWLALFTLSSHTSVFPFTPHKLQFIESRRVLMSDFLLFDVLLIRGAIPTPDILFPPSDCAGLRKLLEAIDGSVYDRLKKDCLVYILLKWAWDADGRETNPGWDIRFVEKRCIPPQFAALADAYWLLDTGSNLAKAVSILSDARLNRDYVSKILQALSLSSPATSATDSSPTTAALIVKYIRTAKPLLIEPDDIDLYVLSLAQVSFTDAWTYQRTFPEGSGTRERLLSNIVRWCLMPKPKQVPLAQLVAFPLTSYEQSFLHALALSPTPSSSPSAATTTPPLVLSPQAISVLQDLVCVRAIQSGDYTRAIKLDRQFSSVPSSPPIGGAASTSTPRPSMGLGTRENTDRKLMMHDLLAFLPPAERTLLEEEIGRVATGVKAPTRPLAPRQSLPGRRAPLGDLTMSWEDVESPRASVSVSEAGKGHLDGVSTSPALSGVDIGVGTSPGPARFDVGLSSAMGRTGNTGRMSLRNAAPAQTQVQVQSPSPFATLASRPSGFISRPSHTAPTIPLVGNASSTKFTAFGTPLPPAAGMTSSNAISEPGKTIFATTTGMGAGASAKPTRASLFETSGSAKHAPNAFYKPPPVPTPGSRARDSHQVGTSLVGNGTGVGAGAGAGGGKQNGKEKDEPGDDVSMGSGSDIEVDEHDGSDEGQEEEGYEDTDRDNEDEDEDGSADFITHDKTADLTVSLHDDEEDEQRGAGAGLGFSVFSVKEEGSPSARLSGKGHGYGHSSYHSPPSHSRAAPPREADVSISTSATSSTTKRHAPPGAFHAETDEDEDEDLHRSGAETQWALAQTHATPGTSPHRRLRTSTHTQRTPPAYSRSQSSSLAHQAQSRGTKGTAGGGGGGGGGGKPSTRRSKAASKLSGVSLSQSIPGSLVDDDEHEHENDYNHVLHEDEETETEGEGEAEQDEEDDDIAPLPSRSSRRTRSRLPTTAMLTSRPGPSSNTSAKSKAKPKPKPKPSEEKTPPRRSSRLSTASSVASLSPDRPETTASPTKARDRKNTVQRAPSLGTGAVATRSSARRKR